MIDEHREVVKAIGNDQTIRPSDDAHQRQREFWFFHHPFGDEREEQIKLHLNANRPKDDIELTIKIRGFKKRKRKGGVGEEIQGEVVGLIAVWKHVGKEDHQNAKPIRRQNANSTIDEKLLGAWNGQVFALRSCVGQEEQKTA